VGQQGGLVAHALGEVAHQVGHRGLRGLVVGARPTAAHIVHPGARALARSGVGVEVELTNQLGALGACALDAEEAHGLVPHGGGVGLDLHLEQPFDQAEQALEHRGLGEVLFDLLIAESVAGFFELLAHKGHVPGLQVIQAQFAAGKVAQLGHVFLSVRTGALGQVTQEAHHLRRAVGHLGHQRHIGKAAVAQQAGFFLAQAQDVLHELRVVALSRAEFAGTGAVGAVHGLAQAAVGGVLHHRQVARHVQRELVAVFALRLGGSPGGVLHVLGHPHQFVGARVVREGIRGVHHMLRERLRLGGLFFLDGGEAGFGLALQFSTTQHEAAQGVVQRTLPGRTQALFWGQGVLSLVQGFVLGVQALIGPQTGVKLRHAGQVVVERRTQLGRVGHAVEVTHGAPGTTQAFGAHVQQQRQGVVIRRHVRARDLRQRGLGIGQQHIQSRRHVLGLDLVEQGQAGGIKQWVGAHGGVRWVCRMNDGGANKDNVRGAGARAKLKLARRCARPLPWC